MWGVASARTQTMCHPPEASQHNVMQYRMAACITRHLLAINQFRATRDAIAT